MAKKNKLKRLKFKKANAMELALATALIQLINSVIELIAKLLKD